MHKTFVSFVQFVFGTKFPLNDRCDVNKKLKRCVCLFLYLDCIKPQLQAVSIKKDTLSANHQFIIVICVLSLIACAVIMFLNLKMNKKDNIMKKLVQTDESI